MKFDEFLFSHLGEIGRYQTIQFVLVCIPCFFCSMNALSWTFSAVAINHRCALEGERTYSPYWSDAATSHIATTSSCVDDEWKITPLAPPMSSITLVQQSAMGRWEIVCDRAWIKAFIQSAYYAGQMVGSLTFGVVGDKIGRKSSFFVAIGVQIFCGFAQSAAPFWWMYALARAGTGFSHPGVSVSAVVIGTELMGPKYRRVAAVSTALCMALGQCILGVLAYFITDYQMLHVAITAPSLLFIAYKWLIHESARWLVSTRRFYEADRILQKAAKTNGVTLPDEWWSELDGEGDAKKSSPSTVDLLRTPVLRKRSLVVFYLWPVVSMVYYGLSMKSDILGGDIYFNFIVGGLMETPALLLVYLLIDRVGRRSIIVGGYTLAGVCLLSNLFMGDNVPHWVALVSLLISRGAISATYAGVYTFTPELFPTTLRNTAMGACGTTARVGAISASFICFWVVDRYGKEWMIIPFGVMSLLAAVLIVIFLPETMGRPLPATIEEIEDSTDGNKEQEMQHLTVSTDRD